MIHIYKRINYLSFLNIKIHLFSFPGFTQFSFPPSFSAISPQSPTTSHFPINKILKSSPPLPILPPPSLSMNPKFIHLKLVHFSNLSPLSILIQVLIQVISTMSKSIRSKARFTNTNHSQICSIKGIHLSCFFLNVLSFIVFDFIFSSHYSSIL